MDDGISNGTRSLADTYCRLRKPCCEWVDIPHSSGIHVSHRDGICDRVPRWGGIPSSLRGWQKLLSPCRHWKNASHEAGIDVGHGCLLGGGRFESATVEPVSQNGRHRGAERQLLLTGEVRDQRFHWHGSGVRNLSSPDLRRIDNVLLARRSSSPTLRVQ